MDVHRLRLLRELADRGSVTAVADAMGFTPSAVSQQLRILSREAGLALTERHGRGLRLTAAGRTVVTRAETVLAALAELDQATAELRTLPLGVVHVVLFPSGARMLLPGLLSRARTRPGLVVRGEDRDLRPDEVATAAAEVDVVVTHHDERTAPPFDDRLTVRRLLREPLDVAVPAGHPLADRDSVRPADLADAEWIGVGVGWPVDDVLRSLGAITGTTPRIVQRVNDFSVTERLVAAGHGVALLPRYSTDTPRLVLRPLAGVRLARLVLAVARRDVAGRPAVGAVLDDLAAEAADRTGTEG